MSSNTTLPPIRFIKFDDFKTLGSMPRYPEQRELCVNLSDINDRDDSLMIFISHGWLRGWDGAEGWDGRPHPDNVNHDKYKLCVSGISKILSTLAPGMSNCYIWLDFGCIDQSVDPAGELKQLDEIVRCCDCIFTPIHGMADLPDLIYDWYDDYRVSAWDGERFGYVNRGWCRIEMFYAANIPMIADNSRCDKLSSGLKFHISNGVRPHLLYGTFEESELRPP